jgi:hypothetical protein
MSRLVIQEESQVNLTKNTIAGAIAAVLVGAAPAAHADIELGAGFSVAGFLDMSYANTNDDFVYFPDVSSAGIDQFETDFKFTGENGVSAQVDIEYGEQFAGSDDETFVEQAFVTKSFNEQFSLKVGRFLSYTGWETEEPTGLFQYSGTGYAPYFYGYYQNGVSAYFDGGVVDVMASVVTSAFDPLDTDTDDMGYEVGLALTPVEGLTAKLFYITDDASDTDIINFWASYAVSGFTFAAEYNTAEYANDAEGDGFLLMGNYATGPFGITLRYHDFSIENGAGATTFEDSGITLSPSYKVGSNLLLVAEYRVDDFGTSDDGELFALEALFTF